MTIGFIDAHRHRFPVAAMCRVLAFSERTFYAVKARPVSARAVADIDRKVLIEVEWKANYSCYGARRLHKHLHRQGHTIARCTIARLMRDLGIRGVQRGRKQFTTHADKTALRPPDLVKRDFTAAAPNELWLADITYCSTWEGSLYVAFILDVYARTIVGWQIATRPPQNPPMEDTRRSPRRPSTLSTPRQCCDDPLNPSSTRRSVTPTGSPPPA